MLREIVTPFLLTVKTKEMKEAIEAMLKVLGFQHKKDGYYYSDLFGVIELNKFTAEEFVSAFVSIGKRMKEVEQIKSKLKTT